VKKGYYIQFPGAAQKAVRNSLLLNQDPERFGQKLAQEANERSLSHVSLLGSGDGGKTLAAAIEAAAKYAPRTRWWGFSRNPWLVKHFYKAQANIYLQLSLDKNRFVALLNTIIRRPEKLELRAMNGLYPPTIDGDVVNEMKQAGFETLNLSLGSISSEQLQRFQRSCVRDAFDNALDLAETHGLDAVGYVIAGAPNQTAEASVTDLLFLAHRRVLAGVSVFYSSPGSPDFTLCEQLNILPPSFSLMRSSALPISHSTTRKEAVTILRLGRILNFMKFLVDSGKKLPHPEEIQTDRIDEKDLKDRTQIGITLLQWFLFDGKIRGVDPSGKIYEHAISTTVTWQFIEGLKRIEIRGVRT